MPLPLLRDPSRLTQRRFDVLIVGGGINGAGLARDLALRGLAVALVEQEDFACGTSSASTKLIHGGLRYLENFDLRLVFEACRERRTLQRIAPHLVQPLAFFIPVYKGDPRPLWMVRAGMLLYDTLAMFRNTHRHAILAADEALAREPVLDPKGLSGVAHYWDCRMDDARLCLENVLAAAAAGAEVVNGCRVTGLLRGNGRIHGARLHDRENGAELEVEAKVVVNAAGPWLDAVCNLEEEAPAKLRLTRGTHILVPRINRGEEALYLTAGKDARLFFVIPWGGESLIGTTDVDFAADPSSIAPTEDDIAYLIAESGRHLRDRAPRRDQVLAAFAGLRPLIASAGVGASKVSREHQIFESPGGLISVGGGKYTTYRAVAAEVATKIATRLGRGQGPSSTAMQTLPGGAVGDFGCFVVSRLPELTATLGVTAEVGYALLARYGSRIDLLLELARQRPELVRPVVPDSKLLALEVVFAATCEFARTPDDILRRRTTLALGPGRGLTELPAVAALLQQTLGVDDARRMQWEEDYRARHAHY
jgi:glycerol-3-phosphate dehydrogenase